MTVPPGAQQKKRLGLLAILAIGEARGISRDRIQAYLWPESDSARSRHALDQLIYATRRSLGEDPIVAQGRELRLERSIIQTDIGAFEEAVAAGDLEKAAAMYGGPLLDGFHLSDSRELESWIDGERDRLATIYMKTLETLALRAASAGDQTAAVSFWRKLVLADPFSSRIAIELMRAMAGAGDRTGALQHGRSYEELVLAELGVAPDVAITKFAASLSVPADEKTPAAPPVIRRPAQLPAESGNAHLAPPRVVQSRWMSAGAVAVLAGVAIAGTALSLRDARGESRVSEIAAAKRYYVLGMNAWNDRSKDALDSAVIYFRRAVEADPLYAVAHAGLANAYVMIGYSGYRPAGAMFPKAKAAAMRSIELDSTNAEPHAAMGMALTWERKFDDARRAYERAIALDPKYATAHQWYGILQMIVGKRDEAVSQLRQAAALDPLSLQIQNNYATFLSANGDREGALRHYRKLIDEEPDSAWVNRNPWLLTNIAGAYAASGQLDRALRAAEQSVRILPGHPRAVSSLASVYRTMGQMDKAREVFATADTANEHYPAYRAFWLLGENKVDSAFIWFGRVEEWGIPIMISLRNAGSPELRRDRRYVELLRKIGMPVDVPGR
ncbi:MAG: tetratricopeptide repeat protein [Gemmatimonadota bacterium]|nr:tetratricopeptide repeat protein [Gemmatimonadota bacterium]